MNAKANASNLATIESSTTASQAYSAGDHLVLNGQLYEVTTAISSGETLTVGTNIEARSVGEELTALNNGLNGLKIVASERKQYTLLASGAVNVSNDYPSSTNVIVGATAWNASYPNGLYAIVVLLNSNYWLKVFDASTNQPLGSQTVTFYITYLTVNS